MMASPDLAPPVGAGVRKTGAAGPFRGSVKEVRLLLPVWGERFIVQFLRISLPTLLAPGNLPAVAAAAPCTFVFLTNVEGEQLLREHPATAYLRSICKVEFEFIDDLVTGDSYSTTLTLAYARAVRSRGPAMRDTCFFFLISDYIMADGSLRNVLERVQSGCNGVLAGNFQVVDEDAKATLFSRFDSNAPAMAIGARDLVAWAMNYLHPMTLANTVNFPMYRSVHSNRLFWRVNASTLIGRFYLMHMIAIRPEVTEFQVGSSCDYSFIPEMCPSGNVHAITDSDEYLVIEMQKRSHEAELIRLGAIDRTELAASLAEWTTAQHRMNAHSVVVYHSAELSNDLQPIVADSRAFVEAIEQVLPGPQPFRDHPYWIGAIAAHRREIKRRMRKSEYNGKFAIDDDVKAPRAAYHDFIYNLRDQFFGRPPQVRLWHPRAPDYAMVEKLAAAFLMNNRDGRTLIISSMGALLDGWLENSERTSESISIDNLSRLEAHRNAGLPGRYDGCLLVLRPHELEILPLLLDQIKPHLSLGDFIVIFILNGHGVMVGYQFNDEILRSASFFFDRTMSLETTNYVMAGWASWASLRGIRNLFVVSMKRPAYLLAAALPMVVLGIISFAANLFGRRIVHRPTNEKLCSSVGVAMRIISVGEDVMASKQRLESAELELATKRFENMNGDTQPPQPTRRISA